MLHLILHLSDVISDSLLAKDHYDDWVTGVKDNFAVPTNITLLYYSSQLDSKHKFIYFLIFIISPCLLYLLEIMKLLNMRLIFSCQEGNKLTQPSDWILVWFFPLSVFMWPIIISSKKAYMLYRYHTSQGHKKIKWKAYSTMMSHG